MKYILNSAVVTAQGDRYPQEVEIMSLKSFTVPGVQGLLKTKILPQKNANTKSETEVTFKLSHRCHYFGVMNMGSDQK